MDVISLHQAGFNTAVAACGTALTADQVRMLGEYADGWCSATIRTRRAKRPPPAAWAFCREPGQGFGAEHPRRKGPGQIHQKVRQRAV